MLILLFQSICNIFLLFEEEVASKNDSFLKTEEFSSRVVCFSMICIKLLLLAKRTLRNKQCLLYAKLGCARLQLQASLHCTRWHELCDDGSFSSLTECRACEVYSTELKTEEFECFACVFFQTPSPFGYSLLSKRESCFLCYFVLYCE